jgi:hypothetical protein
MPQHGTTEAGPSRWGVRSVDLLPALSGPFIALAGVWLGSWLSSRGQERIREREDRQRYREAARAACGEYLTAARQFDQYVKLPSTRIAAIPHPTGTHPIPLMDERGEPYQHALEAASAGLLFVAVSPDVVERAGQLRLALMRLAAARVDRPAGTIPDEPVLEVLVAEQAFVDAARRDLGLRPLSGIIRTMPTIRDLPQ